MLPRRGNLYRLPSSARPEQVCRIATGGGFSARELYSVYGLPETFVVDKTGRIRYRRVGPIDARELEKVIRPLIRELEK